MMYFFHNLLFIADHAEIDLVKSYPDPASKSIETEDEMMEIRQKRDFMNRYPKETIFYRCPHGKF